MWSRWVRGAGVLLLIALCYLLFLWDTSIPLTGDQKTYLTIAMEMRQRSGWIVPFLFDRANFLKPPLQYWATLLGWKTFGFGVLGAILPSVAALLGSAVFVRALSVDRDWLRALFFSGILSVMTYGTTAQMEIWIVLFYLLCWRLLRGGSWGGAWVAAGVMSWIKGPLYPVLFSAGVALHDGVRGLSRRPVRALAWVVFGAALGLSWYALAARTHYEEIRDVFFLRENLGKMSTSQGSPLGLWSEFLATLFPVLFWWIAGLFTPEVRANARKERRFWISYGLVPALFFTFFPYRVNTYLFLLVPLVCWSFPTGPMSVSRPVRTALGWASAISGCGLWVLAFRLFQGDWMSAGMFLFLGGAVLLWVYGHLRLRSEAVAVGALLLVTAIRIFATTLGERELSPLRAARMPGQEVAYLIESEDIWHEIGQVSAAMGAPIRRIRPGPEQEFFLRGGGLLILSDEQRESGEGLVCEPWSRLRRRLRFPLEELLLGGLSYHDPSVRRTYLLCRGPRT